MTPTPYNEDTLVQQTTSRLPEARTRLGGGVRLQQHRGGFRACLSGISHGAVTLLYQHGDVETREGRMGYQPPCSVTLAIVAAHDSEPEVAARCLCGLRSGWESVVGDRLSGIDDPGSEVRDHQNDHSQVTRPPPCGAPSPCPAWSVGGST